MCTLCGWRTRARPGCQLCPAQGSLCGILKALGDGDHVCWCSLPARTLPSSHRPPRSLHTSTSTHTLPWVKTHSLTFTQTVFSHPEGHTHIQKALSAQRVQRDNKTLPYVNWIEPESKKGGWQTEEKDPWRQRALYRVWEPGPGAYLLGLLVPSWLPKVHCGQGMT